MKKREVCNHFLYLQTLVRASRFPGRNVKPIKTALTPSAFQHRTRSICHMHDRFLPLHFAQSHQYRKNLPMPTVSRSVEV